MAALLELDELPVGVEKELDEETLPPVRVGLESKDCEEVDAVDCVAVFLVIGSTAPVSDAVELDTSGEVLDELLSEGPEGLDDVVGGP